MIEFYFDCGSPATYLGFHNVQPLAAAIGTTIEWKPIVVGGVFNAVNPAVYERRKNPVIPKRDYQYRDVQTFARIANIRIAFPQAHFPVNSLKVMRGCVWLKRQGKLEAFARAAFEAYWGREEDFYQDDVLARICEGCGVDPAALQQGIAQPDVKDELRANTEELIRRGGFGTPTMFVGDEMFWGNDRLDFVRDAVLRNRERARDEATG